MPRVLVVYGPNLNLLGEREPNVYGHETMQAISERLSALAQREGVEVEFYQSNTEGAIIDRLQESRKKVDAVVLNAGALSHYSYALRDAIAAITIPVIEVHMTNVVARGEFRTTLVLAPACKGIVYGFGANSFLLGLGAAIDLTKERERGGPSTSLRASDSARPKAMSEPAKRGSRMGARVAQRGRSPARGASPIPTGDGARGRAVKGRKSGRR